MSTCSIILQQICFVVLALVVSSICMDVVIQCDIHLASDPRLSDSSKHIIYSEFLTVFISICSSGSSGQTGSTIPPVLVGFSNFFSTLNIRKTPGSYYGTHFNTTLTKMMVDRLACNSARIKLYTYIDIDIR